MGPGTPIELGDALLKLVQTLQPGERAGGNPAPDSTILIEFLPRNIKFHEDFIQYHGPTTKELGLYAIRRKQKKRTPSVTTFV